RALAIDPDNALALDLEALTWLYENDAVRSEAGYSRCLDVSPAATSCLRGSGLFAQAAGRCEEVEQLARRFIAVAPLAFEGYDLLSEGLFGAHGDLDGAREALRLGAEKRANAVLGE